MVDIDTNLRLGSVGSSDSLTINGSVDWPSDNIGQSTYNNIEEGKNSSNTVTSLKCLSSNIDRLELTVNAMELPTQAFRSRCEDIRQLYNASGAAGSVALPVAFNFLGESLYATCDARGQLRLVCKEYFEVRFLSGKGSNVARVIVYSRPFWNRSASDVAGEVQNWVDWFFSARYVALHISRLDICADFQGLPYLSWNDDELRYHAVTRARLGGVFGPEEPDYVTPQTVAYRKGGARTGHTIGKGAAMVRIYDKLRELQESKKDNYYAPHWQARGYESGDVVRVEFQLRTEFLRYWVIPETGEVLRSLSDMLSHLPSLWQYLTREWFRVVEPSATDTNKRRAPTRLDWLFVSRAFALDQDAPEGVRMKRFHDRKVRALYRQAAGCLLSAWAMEDKTSCLDGRYYLARLEEELEVILRDQGFGSIGAAVTARRIEIEGGIRTSA